MAAAALEVDLPEDPETPRVCSTVPPSPGTSTICSHFAPKDESAGGSQFVRRCAALLLPMEDLPIELREFPGRSPTVVAAVVAFRNFQPWKRYCVCVSRLGERGGLFRNLAVYFNSYPPPRPLPSSGAVRCGARTWPGPQQPTAARVATTTAEPSRLQSAALARSLRRRTLPAPQPGQPSQLPARANKAGDTPLGEAYLEQNWSHKPVRACCCCCCCCFHNPVHEVVVAVVFAVSFSGECHGKPTEELIYKWGQCLCTAPLPRHSN